MAAPIKLNEVLKVPSLGIRQEAITFANCTMQSEKYITVREQAGEQVMIHMIDLQNPQKTEKKPITADAAIMNPMAKILALRAGQALQIFNIDLKSKMKAYNMPEAVVYWCWINERTMALVTAGSVYHWSMEGSSDPVKMFDRLPALQASQIINYKSDANEKWMVLIGISQAQDGSNRIVGNMQLYSAEKQQSQSIEGHAAGFCQFTCQGASEPSTLFAFANKGAAGAKLHVIEVVKGSAAAGPFQKRAVDITIPADAAADFPVAMQVSDKYGIIFMVTKFGYVYVFDVETAALIFFNRISPETIFTTCVNKQTGGILGINRLGSVLHVQVDDTSIINYLQGKLNNIDLAMKIAARAKLPGAENLYSANFDQLLRSGQYQEAAQMAAKSPNGVLRTPNTISKFKSVTAQPGQQSPLLIYFSKILEDSKLNAIETIELARPVLQQGKQALLKKWLEENKLECSEDLGDLVKQVDSNMALSIYLRANVPAKVIHCFVETQQYDKILVYANKVGYSPEWTQILQNMVVLNPEGAVHLAQMLVNQESGKLDLEAVAELFLQRNMVQQTTSFLLDALKGNKPEEAGLQTKLLEINLRAAPQVAEAILSNGMLTHYDRPHVGKLCERAGLYQRALEHYTELPDLKRVIVYSGQMQSEFLLEWFGNLDVTWAVELLKEMMAKDLRANLQICVQIATKYSEFMTPTTLIKLFEEHKSMEGLYYYLGAIVNFSQDETVHYKYIVACTKVGIMKNDFKELERITRESQYYPAEKVKDYLKAETKLVDPRPLINVCDKHDMVEELTQYLYGKSMMKYIEVYVQKVNPFRTPQVVGALIDAGCEESQIRSLVMSVRNMCPVEPLVAACVKRNRLRFLLPWLEARLDEGEQDPALHNALAMIYIDTNQSPEKFLEQDKYYDHKVVGAYCEKRDPHLAFVVYSSAGGKCDEEAIQVTNDNALFKAQAKFLVERQDLDLWGKVLTDENEHKRALVDQVVSTALPQCKNSEAVACTVKAFMTANLPNELIELLEKIVLRADSEFAANKNLQNLLILTAVQVAGAGDLPEEHKGRVMEYINRLDKFDGLDIAAICVSENLFEEAFVIYKKFDDKPKAIGVLVENLADLERAKDYATACNLDTVWSSLAKAQLEASKVTDAIDSYVKANDPSEYARVIDAAHDAGEYHSLINFLQMARKKDFGTQEARSVIDTAMVLSYAQIGAMSELEEFVSSPNLANIEEVGEKCADDGMFEAARMLFSSISKHDKLASCLVRLEKYSDAVEAARKANFTRTWKEVLIACVKAEEFRLAQMCGLHLMHIPDEIEELIKVYERRGYFEQLISMMESGLGVEMGGNTAGIYTELAILYAKYKVEKLMEHLKLFFSRMNIPRVIRECERHEHWTALCFLYVHNDEADNAALTMMNHADEAWEHVQFKELLLKCANPENLYKAVSFYTEQHPLELNDLLCSLAKKDGLLDHSRVVVLMKRKMALIKVYLEQVQVKDMKSINEALHSLYIEEEDYTKLQHSVNTYTNFDAIELAAQLEKHELLEMRRVAGALYKVNKRYSQSVELAKKDKLYKDCMMTAATSADSELVEALLRYFVEVEAKECFAAALFTCYEHVRPDVVLELSWRHNIMDYAMPYLIQVTRQYTSKVDQLSAESDKHKEAEKKAQEANEQQAGMGMDPMGMAGGPLMLTMGAGGGGGGYDPYMMAGATHGGYGGGGGMQSHMGVMPNMPPNLGGMPGMGGGMGGATMW